MCGGDRGGSTSGGPGSAALGRLSAQDRAAGAGPGDPTGKFGGERKAAKEGAKLVGKFAGPLGTIFGGLVGMLADRDTNPGGPALGAPKSGTEAIRAKQITGQAQPATQQEASAQAAVDTAAAEADQTRRAASGGRRSTILAGRSIAQQERKTLLGQ